MAAAIARAKAKKLKAQQQSQSKNTEITSTALDIKKEPNVDVKGTIETPIKEQKASQDDSQKSKIAAAIARAKAKKNAAQQPLKNNQASFADTSDEQKNKAPSNITVNDKKARIAAAIAKAKAKKQHAESK